MKKIKFPRVMLHTVFIILCVIFIIPMFIAVMISFSTESDIITYGYSIIPRNFSLEAYKIIIQDSASLLKAYGITILSATVSPFLSLIFNGTIAYSISRPEFKARKIVTIYILITMLFGGGLIPSYILNTQVYGLGNTIWVHLILGLVSGSNIILFKVSFSQIPKSLIESADIDGANQAQILLHIIIPMSKPIVSMIFFTGFIGGWNSYATSMYYISDKNLYQLQYYLKNVISNSEFIRQSFAEFGLKGGEDIPFQTLKFAICVASSLPILMMFPYIQKFFSKGIAAGSLKE